MKKILTLAMLVKDGRILLGLKKRGFGEGLWNGFGGKVEAKESIQQAAKREVEEEVGVIPIQMDEVGLLNFTFESEQLELEVHVFRVGSWEGEPVETEEMRPEWFSYVDVPYDKMWPDDVYWLPLLLNRKKFQGDFHFDRPSDLNYKSKILRQTVEVIL
jgi:8-oxo-dGTP diphosphatase/2-hydroxy-dATP diphosphatase